jgi:hypothetical protein
MRGKIAGLLLVVVAVFSLAAEARACSCIMIFNDYQPCGAYWKAGVVFAGVATEKGEMTPVEGADGKVFTTAGRFTRFTVEESFRGVTGTTIETFEMGTTCDYQFKVGERYFVYGWLDPKSGKVSVHSCSATKSLDAASADLEYARGVARGERTPSIVGSVTRETRTDVASYRSHVPLEAIRITAESAGRTFETKTDAKGAFRFFGLPAGKYRVRALVPTELRLLYGPDTFEADVIEGRCRGDAFTVTSLSTISGNVVDAEGKAVKTKVNLIALDENKKEIPVAEGSVETYTDEAGRYTFDWVAPGSYTVAVNPRSQPGRFDPPYPRAFYPGVRNQAEASVIEVVDGERYEAETFRLPAPLKERTITGVVLMPDGSPAVGATVTLEYTDREWMELEGTDARGRFTLKVYDRFKYLIAAELRQDGQARHSEAVELTVGEAAKPLKLVINQPGYYTLRYNLRKRDKQQ